MTVEPGQSQPLTSQPLTSPPAVNPEPAAQLKRWRRIAVIAIIVSLSITALVGIFSIVFGSFDELSGRVMLTTLLIGLVSVFGLCLLANIGRQTRWLLAVGLLSAAASLVVGLVLIWTAWSGNFPTELLLKTGGVAGVILVSSAHASLLLLLGRRRNRLVRVSLTITLGLIALLALMIMALILSDNRIASDGYGRLLATVAILDVLGTIIVPVVALFLRDENAASALATGSSMATGADLARTATSFALPLTVPGPNGTTAFTLAVPDEVLTDLHHRLTRTRFVTNPTPGRAIPGRVDEVRRLVRHWLDGFDWRAEEQRLNSIPQYLATVDFQNVHYVRMPGRGVPGGPAPLPLLLCHGTPDTFAQLLDLAGLLADPAASGGSAADAFDVIIPSLPGSGFSSPPTGGTPVADNAARILHSLMASRLGYARYGVYAEGTGSVVGELLASRYPEAVVGALTTRSGADAAGDSVDRPDDAGQTDALAIALADSPAALLAWLLDGFEVDSIDSDERERERALSDDDILIAAMLHWTAASSDMRAERPVTAQPALSARRDPEKVAETLRAHFRGK